MVQVPEVRKVSAPPVVMVQTLVVAEVNVGVRPDVAVAVRVGDVPNVWEPGLVKVIVWPVAAAAFTVINTEAAAGL